MTTTPTPPTKTLASVIYSLFQKTGFPANSIKFAVAQALHETGNKIDQALEKGGNNWSGITWINDMNLQKHAKRGTLKPQRDWYRPNVAEYYAAFDTIEDWAIDFKRIISRNNGLKGRPIEATNITDYATRLKANGYYGAPLLDYQKALNYWLEKIKTIIPTNSTTILIFLALGLYLAL